jgi:hypothetical protein
MSKQKKSIYDKMNLTMSCNNMGIGNVVPKFKKKYPPRSVKKLQTYYMFYQKIKIESDHHIKT